MKKPIVGPLIALATALGAHAQTSLTGTVSFDNLNANPAATLASSTFGMVFIGTSSHPIPLDQDINLTLLGGPSAGSLSLISSLTFANGLAPEDNTFVQAPGEFLDTTGNIYNVPGVAAEGIAFLQIEAWLGNDATFAAALSDGSPVGTSGIYQSHTGGGSPPAVPVSVGDGMPSFLVPSPEPTTLALCGLGTASLLLLRRKK
jgi:hypothetical protein